MPKKTRIALTDEDIATLEAEFSIKLPADYIYCMQHYPEVVFERNQEMYEADDIGLGDPGLIADLEVLITLNKNPRTLPGEPEARNDNFFIIGDEQPYTMFIDVTEEHLKVYSQEGDEEEVEVYAESLQDLIEQILAKDEYS